MNNRAYRIKNKDRISAYMKAWEREHKAWRKDYNRRYYLAHRDELIRRANARTAAVREGERTEIEASQT